MAKWKAELAVLSGHSPQSDMTNTKSRCIAELLRVLDDASNSSVYVSVAEVARLTKRSEPTITRICRTFGKYVGANKVQGQWSIHWPTFQTFLLSGDNIPNEEAA